MAVSDNESVGIVNPGLVNEGIGSGAFPQLVGETVGSGACVDTGEELGQILQALLVAQSSVEVHPQEHLGHALGSQSIGVDAFCWKSCFWPMR